MTAALELTRISKRFGSIEALSDASFTLRRGTVHALLGENGAGKTTLMRVAFGACRPDSGRMHVLGEEVSFHSSADAISRGIGMVHQHFALVPSMTVAENVALGMRGRYDAAAAAARVRTVGATTGLVLDPEARAASLPVGAQQRLEIVKALARNARILILDEPTAVLPPQEADELFRWVGRFRDEGNSVVLITHKLREALAVADDITVLRRGATILSGPTSSVQESGLVAALIGADPAAVPGVVASAWGAGVGHTEGEPRPLREARPSGAMTPRAVIASLRHVAIHGPQGRRHLDDVTLDVHSGEIVGVAAVEGSGQHELLRLLAGRRAPTEGAVALPELVAFIPEDRHRDALVLGMTLVENVALLDLGRRRGRMPWNDLRAATEELLIEFDVRAPGPQTRARELSGGNQQKLILGRELSTQPSMLVAENPTRGLDIRATTAVQARLRSARDRGTAVVFYSSDLDEVLAIADRIVVVHGGRVYDIESPTRESVGRAMLGAVTRPHPADVSTDAAAPR